MVNQESLEGNVEKDLTETSEQKEISEQLKHIAKDLEEKHTQKSWGETLVSEYQTRESHVKGGTVERGESTRYERGQIYKAYKILRKEIQDAEKQGEDATDKKDLLKELRVKANEAQKNLDELERQLEKNVERVEIETSFGRFVIPVTVLDLKKEAENKIGEEDERTPYLFWGGVRSTAQQNGCAVMSMALTGQKVYIPMHLEQQEVEKPADLAQTLRERGDFSLHAEVTKKLVEKLGFKTCNMVGYSAGGSIVLEAAHKFSQDPEVKDMIHNLVVIEPLGLEEKGLAKLAWQFGIGESKNVTLDPEARIKVLRQGSKSNKEETKLDWETILLLSKQQFDAQKLSEIEVSGNFQYWVGSKSPVANLRLTEKTFKEVQKIRQSRDQNASLPQLNEVVGGTHSMLNMNALGLAHEFVNETPEEQSGKPRIIKRKDLANSAVAQILQDIKK